MAVETIKEFIFRYLTENRNKPKECYIYAMFAAFTKESNKRQMKYSSFRTEVAWLNQHGYIEQFHKDDDTFNKLGKICKYGKSYYKIKKSLETYKTMERKPGEKIK